MGPFKQLTTYRAVFTFPKKSTHILGTTKNQNDLLKRLFDFFFSLTALICGSPLYLFLMLLVKCTSEGPIFYKGIRVGKGGRLFFCWKFRTMCIDAETKLQKLLREDPILSHQWNTYHKLERDPRITPIGTFLRKTSLDELPQFWNVLKGDLSIVGPRPIEIANPTLADSEIRGRYLEKTDKILSVKPGITCIWQINGRSRLTFEERIHFEELYVDTRNFWLDMKIILKTIYIVVSLEGAH